jgi:hypothetical protein
VTKAGAIASILATAAAWLYLFHESNWGKNADYLFLGMLPAASIVGVSALTLVVVSFLTRPPSTEVVQRFFDDGSATAGQAAA